MPERASGQLWQFYFHDGGGDPEFYFLVNKLDERGAERNRVDGRLRRQRWLVASEDGLEEIVFYETHETFWTLIT